MTSDIRDVFENMRQSFVAMQNSFLTMQQQNANLEAAVQENHERVADLVLKVDAIQQERRQERQEYTQTIALIEYNITELRAELADLKETCQRTVGEWQSKYSTLHTQLVTSGITPEA